MVTDVLALAWPSSTTASETTKAPSSSGVNTSDGPVPVVNGLPFLVTVQLKAKPALLSSELTLVALPLRVIGVPSAPPAGAPEMVTVGATAVKVTENVAVAVWPWPSSAVMVTPWAGASSAPARDHVQVPLLVPVLLTLPNEAVMAIGRPPASAYEPLLDAGEPSGALTAALAADTVGGALVGAGGTTHVWKVKSLPTLGLYCHSNPDWIQSCPLGYVSVA